MRCSGITRGGERCKLDATHGSYCWSHAPETAAARRHRAGKGGRAGGNGRASRSPRATEARTVRAELRRLAAAVEGGRLDRGAAAVIAQLHNVALRALAVEIKAEETDELAAEIAAIREELDRRERARA